MEFKNICFEVRDAVGYITLNNPQKRNPINIDTHRELRECFDLCDYDPAVRAVVIRGAGGNFSAGGDLNAMKARIDAGIRGTRQVCRVGAETNLRLLNVKKPVIAWIEGAITGAGISLALACDFQIISETSKCAFSFVNIGFVPDSGAAYLVTRAVGTTRAKELFLSGRFFSGKDAADWGLFTEAVPAEQLEERVGYYIHKYSHGPSVAYAGIKTLINRAQYAAYADGIQAEIDAQGDCELTEDYVEAVTAFLEKRKPVFRGR
ncbi:MAG: enoyl-CoA hydratase-related protein [Eubacteriales bacterium]|nr:enoyl-CoA hydratase-related protein [Eubacteriales bacterium]